jgi:hypothetical protein
MVGVFGFIAAHDAESGLSGANGVVTGLASWGYGLSVLVAIGSMIVGVGLAAGGYGLRLLVAIHRELAASNNPGGRAVPGIVPSSPIQIPSLPTFPGDSRPV